MPINYSRGAESFHRQAAYSRTLQQLLGLQNVNHAQDHINVDERHAG